MTFTSRSDLEYFEGLSGHLPRYDFRALYPEVVPLGASWQDTPTLSVWRQSQVLKGDTGLYEVNMMLLAGDCAVSPRALVQVDGRIYGFLMTKESPLTSAQASNARASEMYRQVNNLHNRRIVHGDIKLSNFLLCSDGRIRLCDFDGSALNTDPEGPSAFSVRWLSPYRARLHTLEPMDKDDDLFALGVTIWEFYTGRMPHDHIASNIEAQNYIASGRTVDLDEISDQNSKALARRLMAPMLAKR